MEELGSLGFTSQPDPSEPDHLRLDEEEMVLNLEMFLPEDFWMNMHLILHQVSHLKLVIFAGPNAFVWGTPYAAGCVGDGAE